MFPPQTHLMPRRNMRLKSLSVYILLGFNSNQMPQLLLVVYIYVSVVFSRYITWHIDWPTQPLFLKNLCLFLLCCCVAVISTLHCNCIFFSIYRGYCIIPNIRKSQLQDNIHQPIVIFVSHLWKYLKISDFIKQIVKTIFLSVEKLSRTLTCNEPKCQEITKIRNMFLVVSNK